MTDIDPTLAKSMPLLTCPACEREVNARITYSVALGDDRDAESRTVNAKATVVGLAVSHDCTPKVTR